MLKHAAQTYEHSFENRTLFYRFHLDSVSSMPDGAALSTSWCDALLESLCAPSLYQTPCLRVRNNSYLADLTICFTKRWVRCWNLKHHPEAWFPQSLACPVLSACSRTQTVS